MNNNQVQATQSMMPAFRRDLDNMQGEIEMVLPKHVTFDRFKRVVLTAVQQGYGLNKCTPKSIFAACLQCAKDGLMPDGREAALVAFKDTCQYMPMVSGLIKLARQSGDISTIIAQIVYEKDEFEIDLFSDQRPSLKPFLDGDRGKFRVACAVVQFKDGTHLSDIMTFGQIEKVRKISRAGSSGPWVQHWDEMARKTVLRRLIKYLSLSPEMARAIDADNATYNVAPDQVEKRFTSAPHDFAQDDGLTIDQTTQEPKANPEPKPQKQVEVNTDPTLEPETHDTDNSDDQGEPTPSELMSGCTDWPSLKAVYGNLAKGLGDDELNALRADAWSVIGDIDAPSASDDATVFSFYLATNPKKSNAMTAFQILIQTDGYKALSDGAQKSLAARLQKLES